MFHTVLKVLATALAGTGLLSCAQPSPPLEVARGTVITGVTVVDTRTGGLQTGAQVVLDEGRIQTITTRPIHYGHPRSERLPPVADPCPAAQRYCAVGARHRARGADAAHRSLRWPGADGPASPAVCTRTSRRGLCLRQGGGRTSSCLSGSSGRGTSTRLTCRRTYHPAGQRTGDFKCRLRIGSRVSLAT